MTVVAGALLGRDSAIVAAIATGVSAVALAPLRTRLQRRVDARLYPLRQAVRAELARLRTRIDDGRARPEDLEDTLRRALRDPELRVGYVLRAGPAWSTWPRRRCRSARGGGCRCTSATHRSGRSCRRAPRRRGSCCGRSPSDVGLIVEVIRSRLELTEALREVADSRARILHAGYRERRRLERDLHDGAQQRLVSLGMAVRLAQRHLGDPGFDVNGLLDQAVAELSTAVAELRAIATGLRPLDLDSGLGPAIRSLTTGLPIPVVLELDEEEVPDDVATTAYYVASEALANVIKHADAETVAVSVARQGGHVHVRISDDGRGGAQPRPVRASPGWSTGSRPRAGGSPWSRGTARGSRRCCRAHGDRRGLRPVPRGSGAAPRRRGPRDRRRRG